MNLIQVANEFAAEEQCLEFLSAWRWPNGVRCPICRNDKVAKITRKTEGDIIFVTKEKLIAARWAARPPIRWNRQGCSEFHFGPP